MGKAGAIIASFILFLLAGKVAATGRHLHYDAAELVSDGEEESLLHLKGMEEQCQQMYGFLPCSTNIPSHIFLIFIYEYLLYHGESYAGGDGRIFRVFGKNFVVATFSQLLDPLPESLILLASGLSSSKEKAQDYIVTGAGLLAGSSVLHLTVLWGVCFICGRKKFYLKPDDEVKHPAIQLLTGSGVLTDEETSYHAKVMLFSLIPFVVILLPSVFGLSYSSQGYNIVVLVSLSVSVICFFTYFCYQFSDDRIRKRRLAYAEVEQRVEMLVPFYEVEALMLDREKHLMAHKKEMESILNDAGNKGNITRTTKEFCLKLEEWLDDPSPTEYNEVAKLLLEDKKNLIEEISTMMKEATKEKLLGDDGEPDSAINGFFDLVDDNHDESITPAELKNCIMQINDEKILVDDEVADIMIRHFDIDRNGNIERKEFISGVKRCLKIHRAASGNEQKQSRDSNQGYKVAEAKANTDEMFKAIMLLIFGIFMLTALAEPLVVTVEQFSESVKIEPFFVSFILVPLATNARTAIAAIRAAKQKKHITTSLTFSEIYHKVFMNNILGFCVLVSVIYFRGLKWHFSAEVLVVVIVCIVMGLLASFRSKFPSWTLLIAFPLYPISLIIIYFVDDTFNS